MELGKLIEGVEHRDAIHVAVVPVVAPCKLKAGQHVGTNGDPEGKLVGIVDPYLKVPVHKGDKFWLFLYPNTTTALRHAWEHPDFAPEVPDHPMKANAVAWLTDFADSFEMGYDQLIAALTAYVQHGKYYTLGTDTPEHAYADRKERWLNFEMATGITSPDKDAQIFSCSC